MQILILINLSVVSAAHMIMTCIIFISCFLGGMAACRHADYFDNSEPRDHEEPQDLGFSQRPPNVVSSHTGSARVRQRLVHVSDKYGSYEEPDRLSRGGR